MYFEINVSRNGKHYFATAPRSIDTIEKAKEIYKHFCQIFPADKGYKIDVTRWHNCGTPVQL